jgi:hypothetical protein
VGLKIAVCIKRVPDMELRFAIAGDRKSLEPSGLKYDMSDFDGYALEVALQLVEKQGAGQVVLVSLGPDGVQETLRKGLAMGAARAIQLKADQIPVDGLAIARALAVELGTGGYDLILFGRMATDTASGAGGMVQRTGDAGIIIGDSTSTSSVLTINMFARGADVMTGDTIVTSGLGGTFPKGLLIGQVEQVSAGDYGLLRSATVKPAVDFGRLQEVMVILKAPTPDEGGAGQ